MIESRGRWIGSIYHRGLLMRTSKLAAFPLSAPRSLIQKPPNPTQPLQKVNLARKTKQDEAAPRLYNLTRKRDETLYQNLELQKACAMLRQEVKRLRVEAEAKGVLGQEGEEAGSDED